MSNSTKFVNLNEYMEVVKELIDGVKEVPLIASGNSMTPFIVHQRDTIFISKPNDKLHKGDMVFFQRDTGKYVMHRIYHINKNDQYFMVGDNQTYIEGPIEKSQIFAIVKKVSRNGKLITQHDIIWKFFQYVWIRIVPFRPVIGKLHKLIIRK